MSVHDALQTTCDPYAFTIGVLSAVIRHNYGKPAEAILREAKQALDELDAELERRIGERAV